MKTPLPFVGLATLFLVACQPAYDESSWKTMISEDCMNFSDGCNGCIRDPENMALTCSTQYCETYQEPRCFDEEQEFDKKIYDQHSWKTIISENCEYFSDGCNECSRGPDGEATSCTELYCEEYQKPHCLDDKVYDQHSWETIIHDGCMAFFDGCNNCHRSNKGGLVGCSRKYCEVYERPKCLK